MRNSEDAKCILETTMTFKVTVEVPFTAEQMEAMTPEQREAVVHEQGNNITMHRVTHDMQIKKTQDLS